MPAASTFKTFTGLAGLEYGFAEGAWDCTGKWDGFNTGSPQWCWKHNGHGHLDFRGGIVNSCDVVFYEIGEELLLRVEKGKAATCPTPPSRRW